MMGASDPSGLKPAGLPSSHGPGGPGPVIRRNPKTGERHLDELVWGLLPFGTLNPEASPRPLNARAETVATHPMFAGAFRERRAIVPMSVYYQRRTTGGPPQMYAISRRDSQPMAVAGLWESFRAPDGTITRTYCIITAEVNAFVGWIHDRMPVVLEREDWPVWLGEETGDPAALLRPPAADILLCQPVRERGARSQHSLL